MIAIAWVLIVFVVILIGLQSYKKYQKTKNKFGMMEEKNKELSEQVAKLNQATPRNSDKA